MKLSMENVAQPKKTDQLGIPDTVFHLDQLEEYVPADQLKPILDGGL